MSADKESRVRALHIILNSRTNYMEEICSGMGFGPVRMLSEDEIGEMEAYLKDVLQAIAEYKELAEQLRDATSESSP